MTTKEQIQAELEHLTEKDMDELLHVIREMQADSHPAHTKPKGFLERLREIKIEAPEDFAANLDEYLYRGKKVGDDADVR